MIDLAVACLMLLGFIHGIIKGAIQEIAGVLAIIVGIIVASYVTKGSSDFTDSFSHPVLARVIVFILTFIVVAILIGLGGKLISGLAKVANLRFLDRLIGGLVGACLVALALGIMLEIVRLFGVDISLMEHSFLIRICLRAVGELGRLLPQFVERLQGEEIIL